MKLSDIKIGIRLAISYGLMLALLVLLTVAGFWLLRDFNTSTNAILHDAAPKERLVIEWSHLNELNASHATLLLATDDAALRQTTEAAMNTAAERISAVQDELGRTITSEGGKALLADVLVKRRDYTEVRKEVLAAKAAGNLDAVSAAQPRRTKALEAYNAALAKLAEYQRAKATRLEGEVDAGNKRGQLLLGGLCAIALVIAVTCTVVIRRSITIPLARAMAVARDVAAGRLSNRAEACSRDETGQLLAALYKMNGDLFRIVSEVRTGTDTISNASTEIAAGNLDLSARTEQQAGSLEETASSMEELTSTVRQNSENARQANGLAMTASDVARRGGAVIADVVTTMDAIKDSANKIVDIIGVIDSIAFQTNILALNAAVEAARAGEQGRGFAVVASEVRTLAQRSANAAKEIKALIDTSVANVGEGSRQVSQAGATMDEIVASVARVTDIMGEISMAGREQETGIEQINGAISEMDAVTQQNAALVEEAAAAAQSLQEQAARLSEVVSVFNLDACVTKEALRAGRGMPQEARTVPQALALA